MILQKILISLTIVTYLIPVSNSMDSLNNIAINNNIQQIDNLEQNNNNTSDNLNLSSDLNHTKSLKLSSDLFNTKSLKLGGVLGNTNHLKLSGVLDNKNSVLGNENPLKLSGALDNASSLKLSGVFDNTNSLKLSGVFNDCNNVKYNKHYKHKNINNIKTINNNNSINISNLDAETTVNESNLDAETIVNESKINNNSVINISHYLNISNNDPAINNTGNQTLQTTYTSLLNKQVQDADININKPEEQVKNNKEDAANAKPKKKNKKHKKKKNKNKLSGIMHDEESIKAFDELQQRITKHLLSNKFKYFGRLHKAIMQSGPNAKIYEQFQITPDILQKYKEYYNKILDNIKSLLPSKLGNSIFNLQFFSATNNTGKILVEIYNIIEDTDSYDPNDEDDINETIKYVVDNEPNEIGSINDLLGKNILRVIGNLAAAIADVCLYTQPSVFQLAFSLGKDNENFALSCKELLYIGNLFGIQELMKISK